MEQCKVDEYLGQEGSSDAEFYQALRDVRGRLTLILTRRHRRPRRKQHEHEQEE